MRKNTFVFKTNLALLSVAACLGIAVLNAYVTQVHAEDAYPPGWLPGSPSSTNNCEAAITNTRECPTGFTSVWVGPFSNCKTSATYQGSDGLYYW